MDFNPLIDVSSMLTMYTIIKGERCIFMKRVLLFFGIVLSMLSAMAEDNVLQSIEIEPVKDTYNIVLKSDDFLSFQLILYSSMRLSNS